MVWAKRRFQFAEYGPYMDRLGELQMADAARLTQYIMVSTKLNAREADYYVGIPDKAFLALFDGFEAVEDATLPKIINGIQLADLSADEYNSRFTLHIGQ
jgi:hypothetical protein